MAPPALVLALTASRQEERESQQREQEQTGSHVPGYGAGFGSVFQVLAALGAAVLLLAAPASGSPPRVTAAVNTGANPCEATFAFGALWVANDGAGTLARVDVRSATVTRRIRVARGVCSVTAAAGAVWVASYRTGVLYGVDPRRGRVVARIRVGSAPVSVASAGTSVWVSLWADGMVVRVDARSRRIAERYRVGAWPSGLAVLGRTVWIGFGKNAASIGRLEPVSGDVSRIPVGARAPGPLAYAFGSVWAVTQEDAIVRVDPGTRRAVATVLIPGNPASAAAGPDGMLWVAAKAANTITRVDPRTNRVVDVTPAGPGAYDVVTALDSVWVTSYAGSDVRRFATTR